ncbi:helix-turn-helix domain-containing protein [Chitinophaga barathri]|uniref:Helix-turn-helix domain-containing protein n=1 Tax=Chitinophaga barathri TaxID=1647451 RepID=A0A3N4MGV9_9BACT|nr:helix-turn-helix domain-containing protein [Chitinophaga barathri]
MQLTKDEITKFEALRHMIHCGIFSRVNISAFTTQLNYSPRAISDKFSFLYQYTILEYYNTVSMEFADALLSDHWSVKEVSIILGYKSVSNFSRTFRRLMNKTASSNKRKIPAV